MNSHFPRKEALSFGWKIAKQNVKTFIPILIGILILNYLSSYIDNKIPQGMTLIRLIVGITGWIIGAIVSIGLINISLKFVDHKTPGFGDFKTTYRQVLNFIASSILYGVVVGIGLVFLLVPGIVLAIRLQFYGYFIADQDLGPIAALQKSWRITHLFTLKLLFFGLILMGINILGALALMVGVFWTFPMTQVASAYMFRKLAD